MKFILVLSAIILGEAAHFAKQESDDYCRVLDGHYEGHFVEEAPPTYQGFCGQCYGRLSLSIADVDGMQSNFLVIRNTDYCDCDAFCVCDLTSHIYNATCLNSQVKLGHLSGEIKVDTGIHLYLTDDLGGIQAYNVTKGF